MIKILNLLAKVTINYINYIIGNTKNIRKNL